MKKFLTILFVMSSINAFAAKECEVLNVYDINTGEESLLSGQGIVCDVSVRGVTRNCVLDEDDPKSSLNNASHADDGLYHNSSYKIELGDCK